MTHVQVGLQQHSGPLPAPADYERYSQLIPNGGERIMAMAEKEQHHRHRLEGFETIAAAIGHLVGTAVAGGVCALFGWLAWSLFRENKDGAAFVAMLVPLAGLVSAITWGRQQKKK